MSEGLAEHDGPSATLQGGESHSWGPMDTAGLGVAGELRVQGGGGVDHDDLPGHGGFDAGPAPAAVLAFVQGRGEVTGEADGAGLVLLEQGDRDLVGLRDQVRVAVVRAISRSDLSRTVRISSPRFRIVPGV